MWMRIVVNFSDGLIKLLQNYSGKLVTVVVKEAHNPIIDILIGFDGSVLLLNHVEVGSTEPRALPCSWVSVRPAS
jgi:hypothetical protein